MNRKDMIDRISEADNHFDVIIIGGGATGVGTAIESASRGYSTLLVEQADFAQGTSSRSTKLVHGGVRYLQQGNISLVLEALKERGILLRNAPHLVHNLPFVAEIQGVQFYAAYPFAFLSVLSYHVINAAVLCPQQIFSSLQVSYPT